ncbi:MAG: nitroreductase family deazaflavin-dependent oxidoreductase [Actinomycetota bacterium]
MPNDLTLKAMNTVHRIVLQISGGRMGWDAGGMPVLELTTTGRKSGKPRSVMLTSPIQEGESIVIVASRGGDDVHPAWYLNLVANPQVQVKYKGKPTVAMTARTATAEERARLWPIVEQKYKGYAGYQQRTDREIPLVLLDRPRNP